MLLVSGSVNQALQQKMHCGCQAEKNSPIFLKMSFRRINLKEPLRASQPNENSKLNSTTICKILHFKEFFSFALKRVSHSYSLHLPIFGLRARHFGHCMCTWKTRLCDQIVLHWQARLWTTLAQKGEKKCTGRRLQLGRTTHPEVEQSDIFGICGKNQSSSWHLNLLLVWK